MALYTRRQILRAAALSPIVGLLPAQSRTALANKFSSQRPPVGQRKFTSQAVERTIREVKAMIADPELAWMFENCYPNTLDTTVRLGTVDGKVDAFVVTGDIEALWLRDSSCQLWSYVQLAKEDPDLQQLFRGLINRHVRCILLDPYANAFSFDSKEKPLSWAIDDMTEMRPGVAERKWEIDSLCYVIRLAHGYWKQTGDLTPFDGEWERAMHTVVATLREQQRTHGPGPYHFQRKSEVPIDTQALGGYGNPARPIGLVYSMFRPSDDACMYSLFVPGNHLAVVSLRQLAEMAGHVLNDPAFASQCSTFAAEIEVALRQYGLIREAQAELWAYEVDGFGNQLFMDDANSPSLCALPYLGCCAPNDPIYLRTRARAWSMSNPYFIRGSAAEGIGSPHVDLNTVWPMSYITRAITSTDSDEIWHCLRWIKMTQAGTGFIHESLNKDNPAQFTRPWFAWANSYFGELIVKLSQERPSVLQRT